MKRLIAGLAAVLCLNATFAGVASAKPLVITAPIELGTYKCLHVPSTQFEVFVAPTSFKYHCQTALSWRWSSWQGYFLEEEFNGSKCVHDRKVSLYANGKFYEARELGEFQGDEALFSIWKNPSGEETEGWPSGKYEVVAPGFSYRAKVFKDNGEEQDKAKSYWAKIVCKKLTLDVGSAP